MNGPTENNAKLPVAGTEALQLVMDFLAYSGRELATIVRGTLQTPSAGKFGFGYRHPVVVSGSADNTFRVWQNGVAIGVGKGHDSDVTSVLVLTNRLVITGLQRHDYDGMEL